MLFASLTPAWSRMRLRSLAQGFGTRDLRMAAFGAFSKRLRPRWDTRPRLVFEVGNRQLPAAAFMIGPTSGTASSEFPRRASWFWKTWTSRRVGERLWVTCTPPFLKLWDVSGT